MCLRTCLSESEREPRRIDYEYHFENGGLGSGRVSGVLTSDLVCSVSIAPVGLARAQCRRVELQVAEREQRVCALARSSILKMVQKTFVVRQRALQPSVTLVLCAAFTNKCRKFLTPQFSLGLPSMSHLEEGANDRTICPFF